MKAIPVFLLLVCSPVPGFAQGLRDAQQSRRRAEQGIASAKFAAAYSEMPVVAYDCIEGTSVFNWTEYKFNITCPERNTTLELDAGKGLGKIKVPQKKDVLIGLSAVITIITANEATSKKGRTSDTGTIGSSMAMGGLQAQMILHCTTSSSPDPVTIVGKPGLVTFASRKVTLKNQISGAWYNLTSGEIVTDALELESTIGLALSTTSANHFNFLFPNLDSGICEVVAHFIVNGEVSSDAENLAGAKVVLGPRIMTAELMRAVNGAFQTVEK